jgi:hypothetical protein
MSDALSVAEAGISALREAENKAGAAFRLLVEYNDSLIAERDALQAKLDEAVKQMQLVKDFRYDPNIGVELNILEATLAKLKGETNE